MRYARIDEASGIVRIKHFRGEIDPVDIRALSDGSPALRPVVVEKPSNPEPRVFRHDTAILTVEAGRVVEAFALKFLPNARTAMIEIIDETAEAFRTQIMPTYPGHLMELELAYREALAVQRRDPTDEFLQGEYPHLEGDIGNTVNPDTKAPVLTIREAATVVLNTRAAYSAGSGVLRKLRLAGKKAVREAATDRDAWDAMGAITWTIFDPGDFVFGTGHLEL